MPPFDKPHKSRRRDITWMRNAKSHDCSDPEYLWDYLWPKFNTMSVPIHDDSIFFDEALAAAKEAESPGQLDKLLEMRLAKRQQELKDLLWDVFSSLIDKEDMLRSDKARDLAFKICATGTLDNLMEFLGRSTFGWGDETDEPRRFESVYLEKPHDDADFLGAHTQHYDSEVDMMGDGETSKTPPPGFSRLPSPRVDSLLPIEHITGKAASPRLDDPQTGKSQGAARRLVSEEDADESVQGETRDDEWCGPPRSRRAKRPRPALGDEEGETTEENKRQKVKVKKEEVNEEMTEDLLSMLSSVPPTQEDLPGDADDEDSDT